MNRQRGSALAPAEHLLERATPHGKPSCLERGDLAAGRPALGVAQSIVYPAHGIEEEGFTIRGRENRAGKVCLNPLES